MVTQQSQTQDALTTKDNANNLALSNISFPKGNNGKQLVLPNQATFEELQKSTQPEEDKLNLDEWKQDMPSSCMDELDELFRDDEEVKQKEVIFNKMNKEYIKKQSQKENDRLAAEALQKEKEDDDIAQTEESVSFDDGPTTQDALLAAISSKKNYRKFFNYDAMNAIFDDSGNVSTHLLEDNEPVKRIDEEMV